jgi:hypothetical protein
MPDGYLGCSLRVAKIEGLQRLRKGPNHSRVNASWRKPHLASATTTFFSIIICDADGDLVAVLNNKQSPRITKVSVQLPKQIITPYG